MACQVSSVRHTRRSHFPCQQHQVSATQGTNVFFSIYMQKKVIIVSSYETLSYILSRSANQVVHRFFSKL